VWVFVFAQKFLGLAASLLGLFASPSKEVPLPRQAKKFLCLAKQRSSFALPG
jgi:hypothetical protein